MIRGFRVPKNKKQSMGKSIVKYSKPKKVYIPLVIQCDDNITLLVKKGDKVFKGDIIAKSKGCFRTPIHSSVSGIVGDTVEKRYLNGKLIKCIEIENDFEEKVKQEVETHKKINDYTKEEFIEKIQEAGIVGMGGAGFPTFAKYDTDKQIKTLIVNAVECEPYLTADHMVIESKCEEILETIDAILDINQIKEAIIAIKKTNTTLIELFESFKGTYLKIKIVTVPDLYPMGWEKTLVKTVKRVNYKRLPIEKGIIVQNVSTIFAIYETLKYDKPLIERVITISGNGLKEPRNVMVKIGTEIKELIPFIGGFSAIEDLELIAGGPMMGTSIPKDDLVVSSNLTSVIIKKHEKKEIPAECLRCGKCVSVCPAKLSPVLIKDNVDNPEQVKSLRACKCIECGLCSYICPAKINVREYVRQAKGGQ